MGQVKKQYQDWLDQTYPMVSPTGEFVEPHLGVKEQWTKEFEKFIDALLTKKTNEEDSHE